MKKADNLTDVLARELAEGCNVISTALVASCGVYVMQGIVNVLFGGVL